MDELDNESAVMNIRITAIENSMTNLMNEFKSFKDTIVDAFKSEMGKEFAKLAVAIGMSARHKHSEPSEILLSNPSSSDIESKEFDIDVLNFVIETPEQFDALEDSIKTNQGIVSQYVSMKNANR